MPQLAGAGFGAARALEEILADRFEAEKLEALIAEREQQAAMERERFDYTRQEREAEKAEREAERKAAAAAAADKTAKEDRAWQNVAGLDSMPGLDPQQAQREAAFSLRDPKLMLEALKPPPGPKMRSVTTRGPQGQPINRMVPETESVEEYREEKTPSAGPQPEYEWVVGANGQPRQIRKGSAQPGDRPYTGTMSRDETSRNVAAEKRDAYFEDAIEAIKELQTTKGQAGATGVPALMDPGSWPRAIGMDAISGSPAAVYDAKRKSVISKIVVPRLEAMRGLGQMSDREFANMVSGATAIADGRLSEEAESAELNNLLKFLQERGGVDRIQKTGPKPLSVDPASLDALIESLRKPGG